MHAPTSSGTGTDRDLNGIVIYVCIEQETRGSRTRTCYSFAEWSNATEYVCTSTRKQADGETGDDTTREERGRVPSGGSGDVDGEDGEGGSWRGRENYKK